MEQDDRDVLELLQSELAFIEQGGYGRSVRAPWSPKSAFQDSLTCINYPYHDHAHPCSECRLTEFVPGDHRAEDVPCHFIPLDETGETIEDLAEQGNQPQLEDHLKKWLRKTIGRIQAERAQRPVSIGRKPAA